ncbi:MAG: hypothetical protein AAF824_21740, partial [Bacteroidota bacterium]
SKILAYEANGDVRCTSLLNIFKTQYVSNLFRLIINKKKKNAKIRKYPSLGIGLPNGGYI